MPFKVKVGPLMVLESQEVVVAFLADQASEDACLMRLLMVKQRAGVAVASSALVAPVWALAMLPGQPATGACAP